MRGVNVTSFFCEDIRQEKQGTDTIVGVLPDNMNLPDYPTMLPKLAVYTRINIATDIEPGRISIWLQVPNEETRQLTEIDSELVRSTRASAKEKDAPFAGFISRTVFSPYFANSLGRIIVTVRVGDEEYVSGALNLQRAPAQQAATSASDKRQRS